MEGENPKANEPTDTGYAITISPRLARAWFDTILNPVIDGLGVQKDHLERQAWSWQFRSMNFSDIVGAHSYIDFHYWPNYEFLLAREPWVQDRLVEYDAAVETTRSAFERVHYALVFKSELPREYDRVTSTKHLGEYGTSINRLFGAYPASDHISYLAQLVINRTPPLPEYYPVHPLWNQERERLLEQLRHPAVSEVYQEAAAQARALLNLNRHVLGALTQLRIRIANATGEPPVATSLPNE